MGRSGPDPAQVSPRSPDLWWSFRNDRFDATESVTVCLLTTSPRDLPLLRVPVAASATNGLSEDSRVMLDRVTTLRRSNLRERIGTLEHEHLIAVERGLVVFLGIAG